MSREGAESVPNRLTEARRTQSSQPGVCPLLPCLRPGAAPLNSHNTVRPGLFLLVFDDLGLQKSE